MKDLNLPEHSPLGGSGAYRWIEGVCPGSVRVASGHSDHESDHASLGTAAHALAAQCLERGLDAWSYIGARVSPKGDLWVGAKPEGGIPVDKNMADAVQQYLDDVRREHPERDQGNSWIERPFHASRIHPLMYGREDFVHVTDDDVLHVWDYKHGVGIVVEVENNPQLMYYAAGMLEDLGLWEHVEEVVLHVHQPRGFHFDGPHRTWTVSVEDLKRWRDETLVPSLELATMLMERTDWDLDDLLALGYIKTGEQCRFCPARFANCPGQLADEKKMEELMKAIEAAGGASKATNEQVGAFLSLFEVAKIRQKALREIGYVRAQEGATIPGWKLGKARSNRIWVDEKEVKVGKTKVKVTPEKAAVETFGKAALTEPALKSPAQIEKLPKGKEFAAEWAFKPEAGLQLVPATDNRPEAGPKGRSMFKPVAKGAKHG